jgi:hypothetical protein
MVFFDLFLFVQDIVISKKSININLIFNSILVQVS